MSWNNLGELQKLLPPSVSTFDIRLMDSKFRNFPPFLFHPPQQDHLAKTQLSSTPRFEQELSKPAKYWDLLLTSQLIPAPLGGAGWDADQFCEIIWKRTLSWINELVFHQLPKRPNVSIILKSLCTLPLESSKSVLRIIGPSSWVLKSRRLHHRQAGIHKNIT